MSLKFTGERMIPEFNQGDLVYLEHISRYFFARQIVKNKVVLDVACGSGYGSDYLLQAGAKKVIGVDISKEAIEYAKKKYKKKALQFIKSDVLKLPFPDHTFDIIVSYETVEHLRDHQKFIKEIKRVLKKTGVLLISTPNTKISPKDNIFHLKELNLRQFKKLLECFQNHKIFYQNNGLSNFILEAERKSSLIKEIAIKSTKIFDVKPQKSLLMIAVCSNVTLPSMTNTNALSDFHFGLSKEIGTLTKELQSRNEELQHGIASLNSELEQIHNSRKWVLLSCLSSWKAKIPILDRL